MNSDEKLKAILEIFHRGFFSDHHTKLTGGYSEPFYLAPQGDRPGEIQFVRDYIRSALHEVAHWCIAGKERRTKDDFGYWYRPDGRTVLQQEEFFKVEVKPQSLEYLFSKVVGEPFEVSIDNLSGEPVDGEQFKKDVEKQANEYIEKGLPPRAKKFLSLLEENFSFSE